MVTKWLKKVEVVLPELKMTETLGIAAHD